MDRDRDLLAIGRELLVEHERRGVLRVRAADLDDVVDLHHLGVERGVELAQTWKQHAVDLLHGRDVHGCRERVVRVNVCLLPSSPPEYSIVRFKITAFVFMVVCVPEPVWKTASWSGRQACPR